MSRERAEELGRAADALNVAIGRVERALASLKLGVRASVPLEGEGESALVFGKHGNAWRLVVVAPDGSESPLVNTSRETRVRAASLLPPLLAELRCAADEELTIVRDAASRAETFARDVEEERPMSEERPR